MTSAKRIKPNDETVSVHSLPLNNSEQNKSFNMNNSIGWMLSVFSPWGCSKHLQGRHRWGKQLNNTIELRNNCKIDSPSILCHCKYYMKEHTTKICLPFNMYFIISSFYKQMNITKAKMNAYLLNLALFPLKQLKIQN